MLVALRYALLGLWVAACLWLLWIGLTAIAPVDVKDLHVGMAFWMMMLSFPAGALIFVLLNIVKAPYFAPEFHPWFYCLVWLGFFAVGLLQWLFLIYWNTKGRGKPLQQRKGNEPHGASGSTDRPAIASQATLTGVTPTIEPTFCGSSLC
jgi:hypothetical protein